MNVFLKGVVKMAVMTMKQKALSIRESYELYEGEELKYYIQRRKLLTKKPAFDIYIESGVVASIEVTETGSPLVFKITLNGTDAGEIRFDGVAAVNKLIYEAKNIEIAGNGMLTEFSVKDKDKKIIGTIKKKIVSYKDTYDIEFESEGDSLLFAAIALTVDETFHG